MMLFKKTSPDAFFVRCMRKLDGTLFLICVAC